MTSSTKIKIKLQHSSY